jgi:hypothetical protein
MGSINHSHPFFLNLYYIGSNFYFFYKLEKEDSKIDPHIKKIIIMTPYFKRSNKDTAMDIILVTIICKCSASALGSSVYHLFWFFWGNDIMYIGLYFKLVEILL